MQAAASAFAQDPEMADLGRKTRYFADEIRKVQTPGPSVDLVQRFSENAQEASNSTSRDVLTDPRMTRWMQENGMTTDATTIDSFIQNNMIPSVRKVTQAGTSAANAQKLAKFTGADIQWRPRQEVEWNNFSTPEDARLPDGGVTQSGTAHLNYRPQDEHYRQLVSQKMQGVTPEPVIHVGRGIAAGNHYTDGTAEGSSIAGGGAGMNLHYGSVRPRLADPGQQRIEQFYVPIEEQTTLFSTRPDTQQIASTTHGEYVLRDDFDEKRVSTVEKFTNDVYRATRAARNLKDLLRERQDTVTTRQTRENLVHDPRALNAKVIDTPDFAQKRTGMSTQDVSLRETQTPRAPQNPRTLKQTLRDIDEKQYIFHVERDPERSMRDTSYRPPTQAQRKEHVMPNVSVGESTSDYKARRTLTSVIAPQASHGGRLPMTSEAGQYTSMSKREEPVHDLPVSAQKTFVQTHNVALNAPDTSVLRTRNDGGNGGTGGGEFKYQAPTKAFNQSSNARLSEIGTNTNDYNKIRIDVTNRREFTTPTKQSQIQRVDDLQVPTSRRATETTPREETIDIVLRQTRSTIRPRASMNDLNAIGESTRGGRKVPEASMTPMQPQKIMSAKQKFANVILI
jgi:hypothetical protein